jgi:hypothetical protein
VQGEESIIEDKEVQE